ncbi:MAG: PBP1A family penicillin-binding protein [Chloroflexi bacterium]|nr:PBP1A family penicillin-binding protein [Chloroflexota bacterium]
MAGERERGSETDRTLRSTLDARRFTLNVPRPTLYVPLLLVLVGLALWFWLLRDLPDPAAIQTGLAGPTTKIFDRHGQLLYEVLPPQGGKRSPLSIDRFPRSLRLATIATEDANFYHNPGLDLRGILRAAWSNLRAGRIVAGGSTITQQVARDLLLPPAERRQRTLRRKLREAILALRLNRTTSKDEILALYLNHTYYGHLAFGAEAAAQTYFGKHVWELDLAEAALLAGLPQSPGRYDPLTHLPAARDRQRDVLRLMVRNKSIEEEEARLAVTEPLHFSSVPFPIRAPHFVMYVLANLEDRFGPTALLRGGLRVTTTLDLNLQEAATRITRRHLERLARHDETGPVHNIHNAALVALDPQTGQILTMLGSPDYFNSEISGAVNVAVALRQPGSAIKPVTYATAFDPRQGADDLYTPATVLNDVPTTFLTREGLPYQPYNYDRRYHGPLSLRSALATSNNVIAVKVLDHVGIAAMSATARRLGITAWRQPQRYGLALTLGGAEVSPLELTAAYAAFAAGGVHHEPAAILQVVRSNGDLLYEWKPDAGTQAVSPQVAYLISDILSDNTARAPAFGEFSVLRLSRPAAAKTGTTGDWRDNWTVGYTPDLVAGVWVGNADSSPMYGISGVDGAGPIWHDFMEEALANKPEHPFTPPDGLVREEICVASGLLPTPLCPQRRLEWFVAGTAPALYDDSYRAVEIDTESGLLASAACPEHVAERVFRVFPPEAREWARRQGIPQAPEQSCDAEPAGPSEPGGRLAEANGMVITSPPQHAEFRFSPVLPGEAQRIPLAARPLGDFRPVVVTLLLDGQTVARLRHAPYRALWPLRPGAHTFRVTAVDAGGHRVESAPVQFVVTE